VSCRFAVTALDTSLELTVTDLRRRRTHYYARRPRQRLSPAWSPVEHGQGEDLPALTPVSRAG